MLAGLTSLALAGCSGETGTNGTDGNGGGGTSGQGGSGGGTSGGGNGGGGTGTEASGGATTETSGSGGGTNAATGTETDADTATEAETETATNTAAASSSGSFGPETFTGSGTSTEEGLELSVGPITVEYSHSGEANFIVTLLTLEGESFEDVFLANAIGSVEGSQVATVNAGGGHVLNVEADGEWEITLEQPSSPQPEPLPIDANGEGPSYIGPFDFSGPTTFQGSHEGESNFIVTPVPVDPSNIMVSIFNEIGQFEGETTARVSGLAYLNIQADGAWTLSTG